MQKRTNISITGTSIRTPTTVARVAPDFKPKSEIATATASSKKLLAPIMPAGAAMSCGSFHPHDHKYPTPKIKIVWIVRGIAISNMSVGLLIMTLPWKEKIITSVKRSPTVVMLSNFDTNLLKASSP